jgi:integrase
MANIKLKFIQQFTTNGTRYYYFRRPGGNRVRLPGLPGSEEFMTAYQAALDAAEPRRGVGASRNAPGTVAHLVGIYAESSHFKHELAAETRRSAWSILQRFRDEHGSKRLGLLKRKHILAILEGRAPFARRNWLRALRPLMAYAVDIGLIANNPTNGIKVKLPRGEGFRPWGEEQIATFRRYYALGTRERLALELLVNTCQRRGDVVRMGRQDIRGGLLHVRQGKTGTALQLPILPELQAAIDAMPAEGRHLTFLTTSRGEPFTAVRFGNWFREVCDAAGLGGFPAHGLRKASMRRLAEVGCSVHQIMAWSGHKTMGLVAHYTRSAEQAAMAREAAAKLGTAETGTELSKPAGATVKNEKKSNKNKGKKTAVQAVEACRRFGMLGAEHLLGDRKRALVERARPRKVALVPKQEAEVVEARRSIGVLRAELLFADRQRALEERPRRRIGGSALKIAASRIEKRGALCVWGGAGRFHLADCKYVRRQQCAAWP